MENKFTKTTLYGIRTFNKKIKEKIGIEKLIKLINEYDNQNDTIKDTIQYRFHNGYIQRGVKGIDKRANVWWNSKSFGFIKWLVDNDKIDRDKVNDKFERPFYGYTNYEIVLMLLSISDTQIEFLINILK